MRMTCENHVDPRDANSPRVIQLETAMGAAIALFDGAQAVRVPDERFAPVKTTGDLLRVRSDAYRRDAEERVVPAPGGLGGAIAIELNKLEMQGNQCRAYFVVTNKNAANYKELKLDLVLFRPDGVIVDANLQAQELVDKYQIVTEVWGESYLDEVDDARVEKLVSRLRQKIEPDPRHPTYIRSEYSIGYRFVGRRG